ncbi:hypothetical protein PCASD_26596, partial [Puccinia coronata f. sp. avenae]
MITKPLSPSEPNKSNGANHKASNNQQVPSKHPSNDKESCCMDSPANQESNTNLLPAIDPIIDTMNNASHQTDQDQDKSQNGNLAQIPLPSLNNLDVLHNIFQLDNYHYSKALQILNMPTGTLGALVFGMMETVQECTSRCIPQPSSNLPTSIKPLIPTAKGLEDLDNDFKKEHLPPGFLEHDPAAQAKVLALVQDINKHVCGQ